MEKILLLIVQGTFFCHPGVGFEKVSFTQSDDIQNDKLDPVSTNIEFNPGI